MAADASGFALATGRHQVRAFETAGELAAAVAERVRAHPHRVITRGVSTVRDGRTEATLFVYGSDPDGVRVASAGYVLGLGLDRDLLRKLIEVAELGGERRAAA